MREKHLPSPVSGRGAGGEGLRFAILLLIWAACPSAAWAHKLNVFAYAEGNTIHGEAYFHGQVPARDAKVTVTDPAGVTLGQTSTDAEGKFHFAAVERCDHHLKVDAGDGHGAEYILPAAELPVSLPARPGGAGPAAPVPAPDAAAAVGEQPAASAGSEGIQAQLVQLRRQVEEFRQETRLHDILGSVGYIVGVAGLAFYFLGVRRRQERQT